MPNIRKIPTLPDKLSILVPVFGPDPRQEIFLAGIESDTTLLANLKKGYPASCLDLSVLQWLTHTAIIQFDLDRKTAFKATVCACVQRLEALANKPLITEGCYEASFSANDDFGRYRYVYTIDLNITSYPMPPMISKQIDSQFNDKGEIL